MNIDLMLTRLDGVRRSGDGWRAICPNPVHHHAKPSLSVTEKDGVILMACFRCHDTPAILGALGLELADLYPERIKDPSPEARRAAREAFKRSAWATAVRVLDREATVVGIACTDMLAGKVPSPPDVERLDVALGRIHHAREVLA